MVNFLFSIKIKKIYIEKNVNSQYNREGRYCLENILKEKGE
jgi:hypothetical protein